LVLLSVGFVVKNLHCEFCNKMFTSNKDGIVEMTFHKIAIHGLEIADSMTQFRDDNWHTEGKND